MILRFHRCQGVANRPSFLGCLLLLVLTPVSASLEEKRLGRLFEGTPDDKNSPSLQQENPLHVNRNGYMYAQDDLHKACSYPAPYAALLDAVEVMQNHYFDVSHGTWPEAIDWTAAVMGTQISSTLIAMTEYTRLMASSPATTLEDARDHENLINRYFTQIASFYFGENAFSLRTQAYDDMLWVVLGWLESIKFINLHSNFHYSPSTLTREQGQGNYINASSWYARQFIPQFAHRARLFYDLASRGWDTTLCSGGMIWNPHLAPYKNAITNQLFIAASTSMYLYFPGDSNPSPFRAEGGALPPAKAHDDRYLHNAIEAYKWLKRSDMKNDKGLYVDGFHIRGWRRGSDSSNGTGKCDLRDDHVYTYNQGVILSGLRGLWEATGSRHYLEEGHELVRNTVAATGWYDKDTDRKWGWAGLGRNGIMEDTCDWSGTCSQDVQTFKGVYFTHFSMFCAPLPTAEEGKDKDRPWFGDEETRSLHQQSCDGYQTWIQENAHAAYVTRNHNGESGEWWGRRYRRYEHDDEETIRLEAPFTKGTDYRNEGVPDDDIWRKTVSDSSDDCDTDAEPGGRYFEPTPTDDAPHQQQDLNDRGRGRTVETQSGGVAVLRALWRLVNAGRIAHR